MTVLDERGRRCPLPVIALARVVPTLELGEEVTLLADDPAAEHDVPAWCRMREQQLVSAADGVFVIRRIT